LENSPRNIAARALNYRAADYGAANGGKQTASARRFFFAVII
jgi:hypothetical protein